MTSEVQFQNLLSAVTDALLADQAHEVEAIIQQYAVPRAEVESLVGLIRRLHLTLVGAQPSRRYVRRLKHDLVGAAEPGVCATCRCGCRSPQRSPCWPASCSSPGAGCSRTFGRNSRKLPRCKSARRRE